MNYKVLKDVKIMSGLVISILLSVMALICAVNNYHVWVLFLVVSLVISFLFVQRADRIMKRK